MLGEGDLDVLIRTGLENPIAIGLAESLLQEARKPFFTMDQNPAARQESGNFLGWWSVRAPREREAEAREILLSVEEMKQVAQRPPTPDPSGCPHDGHMGLRRHLTA
jgi:hypothetical protein